MSEPEQSQYEDLLRRYLAPIRRLAWSYARDASESDDLVQEIALALWTALPRFRGDSSERTWLYRVAHNTALSFAAGRRRRDSREQQTPEFRERVSSDNPEASAIGQQQQRRLWAAIHELPIQDRQIIVLHLEGLSAADIESITGLTAGNIATRLTRIRQRLTARVREEVGG